MSRHLKDFNLKFVLDLQIHCADLINLWQFQSSIITPLTLINKDVLIKDTYFVIKINITIHFCNNRVKL